MNIEETYSPPKSSYKSKTSRFHLFVFYFVHHLLICIASLPTVFFVYHFHLPEHKSWESKSSEETTRSGVLFDNQERSARNNSIINNTQVMQQCNAPLVYNLSSNVCLAPCNWTTMSPLTYRIYYGLMAVGLWMALFASIFIMITWSRIQSLRKFPHVVRFYIVICCICLACCKMLPLRIGLNKVFCGEAKWWSPKGQSSLSITLQGAFCHYFTLALCFWSMCFIANTYLVVVKSNRKLFEKSIQIHIIQSLICWVLPAIVVASCMYAKYPGHAYEMLFIDYMSADPSGEVLTYLSVTLPMQISLCVSLCLLWSVTWCIRRGTCQLLVACGGSHHVESNVGLVVSWPVTSLFNSLFSTSRLDHARNAIRADKDTQSMIRIERQFTSMKVMILLVVGVVLSVKVTQVYSTEKLINLTQKYFECLQYSKDCQEPNLMTPLYAIIILAPGFLCIIFFFLLFMNKDCREIWVSCFQRIARITNITRPRSDTTKSRCSSTLTVLNDKRLSDFALRNNSIPRTQKLRTSSTPNLMAVDRPSTLDFQKRFQLSPLASDNRPRSSSTPVRFMFGVNDEGSDHDLSRVKSVPGTVMGYQTTPSHLSIEIRILSESEGRVEDIRERKDSGRCLGNDGGNGILQGSIPGCVPEFVVNDTQENDCKSAEKLDLIHFDDKDFLTRRPTDYQETKSVILGGRNVLGISSTKL